MASEEEVEAAARALYEHEDETACWDTEAPAGTQFLWREAARAALAAAEKVRVGRRAKVQGYSAGIPWALHVEAWDAYAKKYGTSQSAERLNERGGFGTRELDMFVPGWRDRLSERAQGYRQGAEDAAAWLLTCPPHLSLQEYAQGIRALTGEKPNAERKS